MKIIGKRTLVAVGKDHRTLFNGVSVAGYSYDSEHPRNFGIVTLSDQFTPGDEINWLRIDPIETDNHSIINSNEVFLCNGQLTKPGVIVKRRAVSQEDRMWLRDQDFFEVVESNLYFEGVREGCIIVIVPHTATRTFINGSEFYFVPGYSIALVVTTKKITAGPSFRLMKEYEEKSEGILSYSEIFPRIGEINGKFFYFKNQTMLLNIEAQNYVLVRGTDILAEIENPRMGEYEASTST